MVKVVFYLLLVFLSLSAIGQSQLEEEKVIERLAFNDVVPDGLLSTRTAVLCDPGFILSELDEIQKAFQQIGIDAVVYFETPYVMAGHDSRTAYSRYLTSRGIRFLLFLKKFEKSYDFIFTTYNGKNDFVEPSQAAWRIKSTSLTDLLKSVFRAAINSQKKTNFLINDSPERDVAINSITGKRLESLAKDVNYFKVAIPKFGVDQTDKELEEYFKNNFPVKYEMVETAADEKELRKKGFLYILRYVHTQGAIAKAVLGYDMSKSESAITTIKYVDGELQLKTIPSETPVFKFYFKNMEFDNVHLGSKWDADITWQDALRNHIQGYRQELKMN